MPPPSSPDPRSSYLIFAHACDVAKEEGKLGHVVSYFLVFPGLLARMQIRLYHVTQTNRRKEQRGLFSWPAKKDKSRWKKPKENESERKWPQILFFVFDLINIKEENNKEFDICRLHRLTRGVAESLSPLRPQLVRGWRRLSFQTISDREQIPSR